MLTSWRIAWRNLGRNRKRTLIAVAAIAIGQFAFLFYAGLLNGYMDNMIDLVTGPLLGHVQVHAPGWRADRNMDQAIPAVADVLRAIRATPGVANAVPRLYAPVLAAQGEDANTAMVIGIDPAEEARPGGLLAGMALAPGAHRALVGAAYARRYHLRPGMTLALIGQGSDGSLANDLYTIGGVLSTPVDLVNSQGVVLTLADAQALFVLPGQAHEIIIHAAHGGEAGALAATLARLPALHGLEVLTWQQAAPQFAAMLELTGHASLIALLLVFIAAVAGIANTMMMSTFEQMHEYGTLLALGCGPGRLVRLVLLEASLLGLLGVLAGSVLTALVFAATAAHGLDMSGLGGKGTEALSFGGMQLPLHVFLRVGWSDLLTAVLGVVGIALVAAGWPAWLVSRLQPMEAMRA